MIQTRHLHHFQASRWGRVTEMNKITFPLERCRKNEFSPSHAAWEKIIIGIVWKIIIGNGLKLTHDVEAMIQKRHLLHFQASRWGRVTEMNKSTFPLERCRKNEFSPSHAAWEAEQKTLPMQHGKAKPYFCDTSRVGRSMSQMMKFLLLLILVDLGSNNTHLRCEFVGKVENDETT